MSFLKKTKKEIGPSTINPKKRTWRIFYITLGVILLFVVSLVAYALATGSKIFQNGLTPSSLLKTLYGQEKLKGEDDGRVNILFAGMGGANHPGGELTDSMMVLSLDIKNKKMALLSLPRDLYVPIAGQKTTTKINEAYSIGEKAKRGKGATVMSDTVSSILGVPIQYYTTMDFAGFEKLIDSLGGIDVNVEKAIYDPFYPDTRMEGYEPFKLKAGQTHMNGSIALKYARSRETSSDFDRAARQQKIVSAVKEKAVKIGLVTNPKKLLDIVNIVGTHFRTSLSPSEMKRLIEISKEYDQSVIISKVLSDAADNELVSGDCNGRYCLKPKDGTFSSIKRLMQNIFSQTSTNTTVKIEITNSSGKSGVGATLAKKLKDDYGYDVATILTGSEKTAKSNIIDYSAGAKGTAINNIKKELGLTSSTQKKSTVSNGPDISIIIGSDYNSNT